VLRFLSIASSGKYVWEIQFEIHYQHLNNINDVCALITLFANFFHSPSPAVHQLSGICPPTLNCREPRGDGDSSWTFRGWLPRRLPVTEHVEDEGAFVWRRLLPSLTTCNSWEMPSAAFSRFWRTDSRLLSLTHGPR